MAASYIVYGSPGSGSVPMEAALTLIGQPYEIIGETALREVAQNPEVFAVNPLGQVPALVVPIGEIMTESRDPGLACRPLPRGTIGPTYVTQEATGLSCWMTYVSAEIYGLAWVRGDPMRIVSDERQSAVVLQRIADRRAHCWHLMDEQIEPAKYLLGDEIGVLDLY
ncbi:MAG TPA: glutathione S-transferase, partial [Alphaproteobacteria bacterium]|nr:glutathione S-transferase [Alphaproteobacteria bacterium]